MAATLDEVRRLLDEAGIKYRLHDEASVVMTWTTRKYRNLDGKDFVLLVVQLVEEGAYLRVFMPHAFKVTGPHVDALLRACMVVQWNTKLVQFEYDDEDGEIRPLVEFPLEDAKLTKKQLERCVRSLVYLIDTFYPTLKKALEEGVIELPDASMPTPPRETARMMATALMASLEADGVADDDPRMAAARRLLEEIGKTGVPASEGPPSEV